MAIDVELQQHPASQINNGIRTDASCSTAAATTSSSHADLRKSSRRLLHRQARGMAARTTCIHPQLRDLLVCPNRAGQLVALAYHSLAMYDFPRTAITTAGPTGRMSSAANQPARKTSMQMLNFIPNVLVAGCGLLGAGGHQAEFALRSSDLHSQWSIQMRVGRSINNSASISPHPFHPLSIPRIHVSNNDRCVYAYDVHWPKRYGSMDTLDDIACYDAPPEVEFKERIKLQTPINHTSISPDGRSMVAVGDTNQVFLFDINAQGLHTHIDTVRASADAAFSTSWSRTGDAFAIAAQDGYVTVFDRRYMTPLRQFRTHQRGSAGAARVVKYSQGPHELLAFSEQKNYIHIVDARTYDFVERIYLPSVQLSEFTRPSTSHAAASDYARQPFLNSRPMSSLGTQRSIRTYGRPPSLSSSINAPSFSPYTAHRPNPWDTYPAEAELRNDATMTRLQGLASRTGATMSEQDCPPISDPSRAFGISLSPLPSLAVDPPRSRAAPATLLRSNTTTSRVHPLLLSNTSPLTRMSGNSQATSDSLARQHEWFASSSSSSTLNTQHLSSGRPYRTSTYDASTSTMSMTVGRVIGASAIPPDNDALSVGPDEEEIYDTLFPDITPSDTDEPLVTDNHEMDQDVENESDNHNNRISGDPTSYSPTRESLTATIARLAAANASSNLSWRTPHGTGDTAITGLTWDPAGKHLYASMDKVILEWSVDEKSRRCLPVATML